MISIFEIVSVSVGLAMDAFSVSICKGLSMKKTRLYYSLIIAVFFGGFQALMPIIGYFIVLAFSYSESLQQIIRDNSSLIAFILLLVIGGKMIFDVYRENANLGGNSSDNSSKEFKLSYMELIMLSLATSIDALMIGFAYAVLDVNILFCSSIIGIITFLFCFVGVYIGHYFGARWEKPATIAGGTILILLALKFLIQYLGIFT